MGSLVRYLPSALYTRLMIAGAGIAIACAFLSRFWLPALGFAFAFALCSLTLAYFVTRPPIEVHDSHLQAGRHRIAWEALSHVDEPRSVAPLVVPLTLNSNRRFFLVYTGSRESSRKLLHQIRRHARFALIHGLPYRQFWDEDLEAFRDRCTLTDHQWNVLSPGDEADVEQLFHTLRKEGSLHPRGSDESLS
ncbi:MAG: hypothetical protein IT169_00930 [Bryobacterales bacterium]|nr:hypothetical protein [Bryobacterales bacterium]